MNVVCVCRDSDGKITHLGAEPQTEGASIVLWTVDEIHRQIDNGAHIFTYYEGKLFEIKALHNPQTGAFEYLNTYPDSKRLDDVDELNICEGC